MHGWISKATQSKYSVSRPVEICKLCSMELYACNMHGPYVFQKHVDGEGLIQRGGTPGSPPPPPRKLPSIILHVIVIVECDKINFSSMYVVSETTTRSSLKGCKFQKFPGGACPLVWVHYSTLEFPPLQKNPVLIPARITCHMHVTHMGDANFLKHA